MISTKWRAVMMLIGFSMSAGCAVIPGLDLTLDAERAGAPNEIGGFDLIELTPNELVRIRKNMLQAEQEQRGELTSLISDGMSGALSDYVVGPGDVLTIIVWDHPELTSPTGEFRDPESSGRLVRSDGKIFYPYVGELEVSGLTVSAIRRLISAQLARVVRDPQVDVRVAAFRSQRVTVSGAVNNPSVVAITDRGLTLSEAISSSGGVSSTGSKSWVRIRRNGRLHTIPTWTSRNGSEYGGVKLAAGDEVIVPYSDEYFAYIMGAVEDQAAIPLDRGTMSLAQALSSAGGLNSTEADSGRIFIVRVIESESADERVRIFLLNLDHVSSLMLAQQFEVMPNDVVYVDRTGFGTYNAFVSQILPTVSTLFQLDRLVSE